VTAIVGRWSRVTPAATAVTVLTSATVELSSKRATPEPSVVADPGETVFPEPEAETCTTTPASVLPVASRTWTLTVARPLMAGIVAGFTLTLLADALGPAGAGGTTVCVSESSLDAKASLPG
jgi:hypothetical protein